MLKIVLILLLMGLIIYIGFMIKLSYERRKKILRDFILVLSRLKTEIMFNLKPVSLILDSILTEVGSDTKVIINKFLSSSKNGEEFKVKNIYLTRRDEEVLSQLFVSIGKSDAFSQAALVENTSLLLKERLKDSEEDAKKKGDLAFKLTLCVAVIVGIMFI